MDPRKNEMRKRYVFLILFLYIVFFIAIPPFQLNDEPDHFQYVYYLAQGIYPKTPLKSGLYVFDPSIKQIYDVVEVASNDHNIPNFQKIQNAVKQMKGFTTFQNTPPLTYQAHHPPLYFISALPFFIPVYRLTGGVIPTYYATRLASTFFYFLAIYFAWLVINKVIKNKKVCEYLVFVFAVNPVTLKMGIAVNPDIASTALALGILFTFLTITANKMLSRKTIFFISILVVVATYIKFQNIVFLLFAFLFFIARGMRTKKLKQNFFYAAQTIVFSLVLLFPWFYYSLTTYHSITPSYIVYALFCTANLSSIPLLRLPFEIVFEFRHAFFHFAGFLGWGEPYPFKPFFWFYSSTFIVLIIMGFVHYLKTKKKVEWQNVLLYCLCVFLFFLGVSATYKINRYSCDIQGRYLLAILLPFIMFGWRGLTYLTKKDGEQVAYGLFLFSLWQYFFILCYVLLPRYYV